MGPYRNVLWHLHDFAHRVFRVVSADLEISLLLTEADLVEFAGVDGQLLPTRQP